MGRRVVRAGVPAPTVQSPTSRARSRQAADSASRTGLRPGWTLTPVPTNGLQRGTRRRRRGVAVYFPRRRLDGAPRPTYGREAAVTTLATCARSSGELQGLCASRPPASRPRRVGADEPGRPAMATSARVVTAHPVLTPGVRSAAGAFLHGSLRRALVASPDRFDAARVHRSGANPRRADSRRRAMSMGLGARVAVAGIPASSGEIWARVAHGAIRSVWSTSRDIIHLRSNQVPMVGSWRSWCVCLRLPPPAPPAQYFGRNKVATI